MENQKKHIEISVEIKDKQIGVEMVGSACVADVVKVCCCVVESFSELIADEMGISRELSFVALARAIAKYKED
ncbi:hypothetical protein [Ruminococcus sp.]|uniref:hypothetical protein n=1 Tax=Ruminococcus sp. TaxID=41978 RepID=UPI0025F8901A|nr:hypothetical protein [Ruminococcus sp.]